LWSPKPRKHQEPPCSIEIGKSPPQIIIDEGAAKQATATTPTEGVAGLGLGLHKLRVAVGHLPAIFQTQVGISIQTLVLFPRPYTQ